MLAPLAIDMLYVCTIMLAFGWAYDIFHLSASVGRREPRIRTLIGRHDHDRTIFHA
jgi:hypothetical protein